MSILKIRDENNNIISIPAIKGDKGDNGKSAYQYAQEGGFTGTEEEFSTKLAQDISRLEEMLGDLETILASI